MAMVSFTDSGLDLGDLIYPHEKRSRIIHEQSGGLFSHLFHLPVFPALSISEDQEAQQEQY